MLTAMIADSIDRAVATEPTAAKARQAFTRLSRSINRLMRDQLSCGPVTIQQCYAMEALIDGPLAMGRLATRVGMHQSTLTRVVSKLEKLGYVERERDPENQRKVEVRLTGPGSDLYRHLDAECNRVVAGLLELFPKKDREDLVATVSRVADVLDPDAPAFRALLDGCCQVGESG